MDRSCRHAPVIRADVDISSGGHRVADRRYPTSGQHRPDLIHQGAQLGLGVRVFLQQVRQPQRPPTGQISPYLFQISGGGRSELAAGRLQPSFRRGIPLAPPEQPGEPKPSCLPRVRDRCSHERVARQRHQATDVHSPAPL